MCCFSLPVPEATTAFRLPGLQNHPLPNWQESPRSLPSRPYTTQPTPVISLRAGSRPRTHTTGHTSLSRTRPKSQLLENRKPLVVFMDGLFHANSFTNSYMTLYFYRQHTSHSCSDPNASSHVFSVWSKRAGCLHGEECSQRSTQPKPSPHTATQEVQSTVQQ